MQDKINQLQYVLPMRIYAILHNFTVKYNQTINEIRLRTELPLCVLTNGENVFLTQQGDPTSSWATGYIVSNKEIHDIFMVACRNSVYAYSEQLKNGFLTLSGGHRMAIAGRVVYERDRISTMQNISSLSIRIAGEKKGCSLPLFQELIQNRQIRSCAIISPPGGGKTTMLRDLARCFSLRGYAVCLIDERGEFAGMTQGVSAYDLGALCDVLDGCQKKDGLMMALRCLSPSVMIVDELGSEEEAEAVLEGINGGVPTIFSIHAATLLQAIRRKPLMRLLEKGVPDIFTVLSGSDNPGIIHQLYNMANREDAEYVKNLWNSSA